MNRYSGKLTVTASLMRRSLRVFGVILAVGFLPTSLFAQSSEGELAKQLSNPLASLISVPFQFNYDSRVGILDKGSKATLNVQPVIPITLNQDWNLISRTIIPIVSQSNVFPGSGNQFGAGDIVQSLFFSPSRATSSGVVWGVGPVFLIPTGTDPLLTGSQWGAGPTAVALIQKSGWTVGVLGNHIWSVARTANSAKDISTSFVQPFISYSTPDQWTFGLNSEATYDWTSQKLTVPFNATVSKLVKFGSQPVSLTAGLRYYAWSPERGPKGLGGRVGITFLFPK